MIEQLAEPATQAAVNIIEACIVLLAAAAVYYIRLAAKRLVAETAFIKNQDQARLVRDAVDRLEDVVEKVVLKTEQTAAAALRQAVKDGATDRQELLALGRQAYQEILQTVEPQVIEVLRANLGDVEAYILNALEAQVLKLKQETGAA